VQLVEAAEELLTAFGGERERSAVLDEDKRTNMLLALNQRLQVLQGCAGGVGSSNESKSNGLGVLKAGSSQYLRVEEEEAVFETKSNTSSFADFTLTKLRADEAQAGACPLLLSENEFYTRPSASAVGKSVGGGAASNTRSQVEDIDYVDETGCASLRAVFDGPRRFACDFKVYLPDPSLPSSSQMPPPLPAATKTRRAGKWHQVGLTGEAVAESAKWTAENLIPPGAPDSEDAISSALAMREDGYAQLNIALDNVEALPESCEVHLTDRVIIPRDEDNSLCRAIRTDAHAYALLCEALQRRISALTEKQDLYALSGVLLASKAEWDATDQLYVRQQVWKQVCTSLHKGIRDQLPDFNKSEEEAMPASWQVQVQGRPKAEDGEEEAEPHEDAVCMCCFDGTSVEGNRILFCDGCNAALHQICYGVHQIPEGDFFCDRCQYIKLLAGEAPGQFDYYHAKTAVMCCLCPLQHGGLKPTVDGRWVHLACALWSPETVIQDMTEMSPVNISKVPVQLPDSEAPVTTSWGRAVKPTLDDAGLALYRENCTISTITDPCMFCKLRGGLVQQCCAESGCRKVFHPICAWFEGLYMSSVIEDPTFQGQTRSGLYPSGLSYCFLCDTHSAGDTARPADKEVSIREEQRTLRCKYRINEDDLEQIPGQNRRKRKKPRKQSTTLGRGAGAAADQRELNPDVYDCACCAACLEPISGDVFGTGVSLSDGRPAWEVAEEVSQLNLASPATLAAAVKPPSSPVPHLESAVAGDVSTPSVTQPEFSQPSEHSLGPLSAPVAPAAAGETVAVDAVELENPAAGAEGGPVSHSASANSFDEQAETQVATQSEPGASQASEMSQMTGHLRVQPLLHPHETAAAGAHGHTAHPPATPRSATQLTTVDSTADLTASAPAASAEVSSEIPENAYQCTGCKLVVHKYCLAGHHPENPHEWRCDVCLLQQLAPTEEPPHINCALCPRRGGYFKRTTDFKWAHLYCANAAPGQVRVLPDGKIEIRALPKESKKEKCCICNRKNGACVQCSHVGCTTVFHPICSGRSGKGCIRTRMGEKVAYCFAHLPEGLERLPSGHWVDGYEIERLRYCLERARLILDVLIRREKHKKMLCKAETELLSIRFHKALDKAKKRKSKSGDDDVDLSDMSLYDSESDYVSEGEGPAGAEGGVGDAFVPLEELLAGQNPGEGLNMTASTGEDVHVSGTWTKRGEVKLPKRLAVNLCGLEIDRKDVHREVNQRGFLKHCQSVILKNSSAMRPATQLFSNAQEEAEFGRSLGPKLKKHMALGADEFTAAMRTAPWVKVKLDGSAQDAAKKSAGKVGRPKKGYAFVYDEEEPAEAVESDHSSDDEAYEGGGRRISRGAKRGRARSMSEVSSTPSEGKRGRGRPRKQQPMDAWLSAPPAPAVEPVASATKGKGAKKLSNLEMLASPPKAGRGGRNQAVEQVPEPVEPEVAPSPRKKTKKQLREEEEAAEELAYAEAIKGRRGRSSAAAVSEAHVAEVVPKLTKLSRGESSGAPAAAAVVTAPVVDKPAKGGAKRAVEVQEPEPELDSRTKRQRLREGAAQGAEAGAATPSKPVSTSSNPAQPPSDPADAHKLSGHISREDAKKYPANTLYMLERRLKDILNDLEAVEVPDFTDEELYGAGAPKSKQKKTTPEVRGTRRLVEDFESVPYDAIPEYDTLVPKVVTLETMAETLSAHNYRSMAEFVEDFYTLLSNARSITPAGSVVSVLTWMQFALSALGAR
jgi:hypothetical protein